MSSPPRTAQIRIFIDNDITARGARHLRAVVFRVGSAAGGAREHLLKMGLLNCRRRGGTAAQCPDSRTVGRARRAASSGRISAVDSVIGFLEFCHA